MNFIPHLPGRGRAAPTVFFPPGLSCVIFSTRLFFGLIQPMNSGLEAQESVVMTIKPDPAKTIFWSRISTLLHSNGIKPQRGKKAGGGGTEEKSSTTSTSARKCAEIMKRSHKPPLNHPSETLKEQKSIKLLISVGFSRRDRSVHAPSTFPGWS